MKIVDLNVNKLIGASWNSNRMDDAATGRLKESLSRYGLVQPLVVRPAGKSKYEILNGNQRLRIIKETGMRQVSCVIVNMNDSQAMLLSQALNSIRGEDDLSLKGSMFKKILSEVPRDKVLSLLPETAESLKSLSTIGQDDIAEHLKAWQKAQAARLRHMQLQFSNEQLETVEKAIDMIITKAKDSKKSSPNIRSTAMYLLAKYYLQRNRK